MKILGVHDGHNASACLITDGKIDYCIQEERLSRIKNYWGFPYKSVKKILYLTKNTPDDIDYFVFSTKDLPWGNISEIIGVYKKQNQLLSDKDGQKQKKRASTAESLGFSKDKIMFIDHHLSHAAAAYIGCPWKNEKVLVLTLDGGGDFLCSTVYIGENGDLKKIAESHDSNSLGIIYSITTFMLGFTPLEHEYKIMGMAPYPSSQEFYDGVYNTFSEYLDLDPNNELQFKRKVPEPAAYIYDRLRKDLELQRFDNIAAGLQRFTEDLIIKWVKAAIKKTRIHKIALSGGVFMNVKANKRIAELKEVDSMFVFPSCGDESNSIGASLWVYNQKIKESGKNAKIAPLKDIYFGHSFSDADAEKVIKNRKRINDIFEYRYEKDIEKTIAELLANGEIVARVKGRMEFGARALGNRSILADPSDLKKVHVINKMIKKRDFWMPFAPIILKEREKDYIINPKNIASPYMILAFDSSDRREEFISTIHQSDNTVRPQVLAKEWNPDCYNLIKNFEKITGKGILLNTSFNLHGFPIVCGAEDALWVFENSGLNYMAIGNFLVWKKKSSIVYGTHNKPNKNINKKRYEE